MQVKERDLKIGDNAVTLFQRSGQSSGQITLVRLHKMDQDLTDTFADGPTPVDSGFLYWDQWH